MSNIKKQNSNGKWDVLASGKAIGIAVTNPKLLQEGETIDSVDGVLEKHQDAIDKLQHNVSWLAKHGGGGSGGSGGGGGSDVTEATCDITVNDQLTGSDILINENGLKISLTNISAKVTKTWNVTVRIGATQIASTVLSFTANTFYLSLSKVSPYLTNHTGNLTIGASYEDETNGIYGSSSWSGTVLEAVVNVKTSNYSFNLDKLDTAQLVYNYSVGIVGAYTMTILVEKGGIEFTRKEIPITINSTSAQVKTIDLNSIISTGVDFGGNGSAHSFVTSSIPRSYTGITVLRSDRTEIIDDIHKKLKQLKKAFKEHILYVIEKYGHIDYIFADCAEQILISALQEVLDELHLHIPIKDSIKTPISSRIYAINMLMMLSKIKFVENDTKGIITSLQEAVQDPNADDDRYVDDLTFDVDTLDAYNYSVENWYKILLKTNLGG